MAEQEELKDMSFWDHIDELRSTLIKVAIVLVVMVVGLFAFMPQIFDSVILAPCRGDFVLYRAIAAITALVPEAPQFSTDFQVELINIQLSSQFFIHLSTSFWLALVFSFPIVVYLLWQFISPALYEEEKRGASLAFLLGNVMFFLGVAVGYFVVFPISLRFFYVYRISELVPNQISLDSYMDSFLMLVFMIGLVFEMPLVSLILSKVGILRRSFFGKFRRHAVIALLVLSALITPSDPFSMIVVFFPLYVLYEFSALLVKKD